jgi:NADH-quinone oxidoreductase subunit A
MALDFTPVLLMAGFVFVAVLPLILIPAIFAPRRPTPIKLAPFECGQPPSGTARVHLLMQYYPYLLLYVVLDVISIFLFAWAVSFSLLPAQASLPLVAGFILVLLPPLGYTLLMARRRELW